MSTATDKADAMKTEMGVFSTASALDLLWQKAERVLHTHEIEWIADGAAEQVVIETNALAKVLMGLGSLVAADTEAGNFNCGNSVSSLLYNLHNQVSTISGLAQIADFAGYRVRQALKGPQGGANE